MTDSPWWYRWRAMTIGGVYFFGFFFGALCTALLKWDPRPLAFQLGAHGGPHGYRVWLVIAVALVATCWAVRVWGSAYLRPAVVWNPNALDDRLIVAGPFRFVRNPLYVGNMLLAKGFALAATPIGAVLLLAGNYAIARGLISVEERFLRARYGAAFDAYAKTVPMLIPRIVPRPADPASRAIAPSFVMGLRSEIVMAAFVVGTIALAVSLW